MTWVPRLIRRLKERKRSLKATRWRSAAHRSWIRQHECSVKGCMSVKGAMTGNTDDIVCAHVRNSDLTPEREKGGEGIKPGDNWTIPLCDYHHKEQSQVGEAAFQVRYGIDMGQIALVLMGKSPYKAGYQRFAKGEGR